jgi:hypothetical protein
VMVTGFRKLINSHAELAKVLFFSVSGFSV